MGAPRARPQAAREGLRMTAWLKDIAGLAWLLFCIGFVFVAISVR